MFQAVLREACICTYSISGINLTRYKRYLAKLIRWSYRRIRTFALSVHLVDTKITYKQKSVSSHKLSSPTHGFSAHNHFLFDNDSYYFIFNIFLFPKQNHQLFSLLHIIVPSLLYKGTSKFIIFFVKILPM